MIYANMYISGFQESGGNLRMAVEVARLAGSPERDAVEHIAVVPDGRCLADHLF